MGFPTKNDHFGVFGGYHHLRKHPYITTYKTAFGKKWNSSCQTAPKKKNTYDVTGVSNCFWIFGAADSLFSTLGVVGGRKKEQFSRPVISGWVKLGTHQTATEYSCKSGGNSSRHGYWATSHHQRMDPSWWEDVRYASQVKKKGWPSHLLVPSVDVAK